MYLSPLGFGRCLFFGGGIVAVVLLLLLLQLIVGILCLVTVLLFSTLCPSSFAIILMGKRGLAADVL